MTNPHLRVAHHDARDVGLFLHGLGRTADQAEVQIRNLIA